MPTGPATACSSTPPNSCTNHWEGQCHCRRVFYHPHRRRRRDPGRSGNAESYFCAPIRPGAWVRTGLSGLSLCLWRSASSAALPTSQAPAAGLEPRRPASPIHPPQASRQAASHRARAHTLFHRPSRRRVQARRQQPLLRRRRREPSPRRRLQPSHHHQRRRQLSRHGRRRPLRLLSRRHRRRYPVGHQPGRQLSATTGPTPSPSTIRGPAHTMVGWPSGCSLTSWALSSSHQRRATRKQIIVSTQTCLVPGTRASDPDFLLTFCRRRPI